MRWGNHTVFGRALLTWTSGKCNSVIEPSLSWSLSWFSQLSLLPELVFAPLASLVQGRGQAAQALVLHSWSVEWGIFFLLHLRPAWAVSEWQKFPAPVARGALNHSISVLCEWNLLARAAGHRHITFPYLCQKWCLVHIMCLVAQESQASRKSSQKKNWHLQS